MELKAIDIAHAFFANTHFSWKGNERAKQSWYVQVLSAILEQFSGTEMHPSFSSLQYFVRLSNSIGAKQWPKAQQKEALLTT